MARNTWWVTRPKRSLPPVPRCLMAIALEAEGKVWKTTDKTTELTIDKNLELAGLKAKGKRRDQTGGGARTYRAWLKSLGLVFMVENEFPYAREYAIISFASNVASSMPVSVPP